MFSKGRKGFFYVQLKSFSGRLVDEHGNVESEENFEEAIKAVNSTVQPTSIPFGVKEILDDDACVNLTAKVCLIFLLLFLS